MNGTGTTCSCATATGCSGHTSSTTAATRRWGAPGATSTSRRSAGRRLGRTRQKVTPRLRRTSGGTGMTTTTQGPRLTRSGSRYPTREKPPSESASQGQKRAIELLLHWKVIRRCHIGGRGRIAAVEFSVRTIWLVMLVANDSRDEPLPRAESPNTQWWYLDSQDT